MKMIDFAPLSRSSIGFDRLFDLLDQTTGFEPNESFPTHDIEKVGEDAYRITLAVAGFKIGDIDITAQQNLLVVQGKKPEEPRDGRMLHVGIAQRGFERRFELADYVRVGAANLEDGLLVIDLIREVPEAMKPKKIAIGTSAALSLVEDGEARSQAA